MILGHNVRAFIEDGPAVQAIRVREARSSARSWHALNPERRLALVEHALKPANDIIDDFPLAL